MRLNVSSTKKRWNAPHLACRTWRLENQTRWQAHQPPRHTRVPGPIIPIQRSGRNGAAGPVKPGRRHMIKSWIKRAQKKGRKGVEEGYWWRRRESKYLGRNEGLFRLLPPLWKRTGEQGELELQELELLARPCWASGNGLIVGPKAGGKRPTSHGWK